MRPIFLFFSLYLLAISLHAQSLIHREDEAELYPELKASIQSILSEGVDSMAFPGAQVLVAHRGEIVLHEAVGFHTYAAQRPVQRDDIYDLASVTKASSALLVLMQQYGRGQLDLEQHLGALFPQLSGSNKADIPLRAALAHQGRLRPWVPYWQGTIRGNARYPWRKRWNPQTINNGRYRSRTLQTRGSADYPIQLTENLWLHHQFRERVIYRTIRKTPLQEVAEYRYSGLLFYLLPDYVERSVQLRSPEAVSVEELSYTNYLRREFYDPLGAHTLGYRPLDRGFSLDQIIPTERDTFFRMQLLHGVVHDEGAAMMDGISANAGLFSNAVDLAKLWQMLLQGGIYDGRRYLEEQAVREFSRVQFPEANNRRGLGFDKPLLEYDPDASSVAEAASTSSFGHSGYTGTLVWADPEHEILFIFLSNRVHPSRNNRAVYELSIRPRIMTAVYEALLD